MAMMAIRSVCRLGVSAWFVFLLSCAVGCVAMAQGPGESPERTIPWPSRVDHILDVGASGDFFWAAFNKPPAFHVWQWSDNTVVKRHELPCTENVLSIRMLPHDRWLSLVGKDYCVGDLKSGKVVQRWPIPHGLDVSLHRASRNGEHCAVTATKLGSYGEDDTCIGIVAPDSKEFKWAATLTPDYGRSVDGVIGRAIVPSDDGRFIGVAGWDNGVAMIDVVNKRVLWTANYKHLPGAKERNKVPWKGVPLDGTVDDIAFTPDSKTLYAGGWRGSDSVGAAGCVWGIKVETGEIVSQWGTAQPRPEEYARTIVTVSVSPDGRFVAAGAAVNGRVFLYSTKDGQRRILTHSSPGTINIVSFSPDSKRLATRARGYGPTEIDIWKLPD
jgi:WD40 repeat protein